MRRPRLTALRIALLAVAATLGPVSHDAHAQSAVANGSAANVWVVNDQGETVATYNVAPGAWTERARQFFSDTAIDYDATFSVIDFDPLDVGAIFVNDTRDSFPGFSPGVFPISIAGLGPAQADRSTPDVPSVSISPASGTYAKTTEVQIEALKPPATPNALMQLGYRIDGGTWWTVAGPPAVNVFLVEAATHIIEARAIQVVIAGPDIISPTTTVEITIQDAGPITRDTDLDGVPDIVEIDGGMNPLVDDLGVDSDDDGLSDFEEMIRGSDPEDENSLPLDTDGDGWSDYDEEVRGTNTNDPPAISNPAEPETFFADRPVARGLREVEYLWSGSVWQGSDETTKQTGLAALSVMSPRWQPFFDQLALPSTEALDALGVQETQLPDHRRRSLVEAALRVGDLPPLRTPGGDPNIVRVGHLGAGSDLDGWVGKAWVEASDELLPGDVADFLAAKAQTFTTAQEWKDAYRDYLEANAVRAVDVHVTPLSTTGVEAVGSLVAWFAEVETKGLVLLGDPGTDLAPDAAVDELELALEREPAPDERSLDDLHAELLGHMEPGGMLADVRLFGDEVFGLYDPSAIPPTTTAREIARLLQDPSQVGHTGAAYALRTAFVYNTSHIDSLDPASRDILLDPFLDFDGDGVENAVELERAPRRASAVDGPNADGDLYVDSYDPCPGDAQNRCLVDDPLANDTDGDSILDPLDNCLFVPNPDQADQLGNGVGDACRNLANIERPAYQPTVMAGVPVPFTSRRGHPFGLVLLEYDWDFGFGLTSDQAQPEPVSFPAPGVYEVTLTVVNTLDDSKSIDTRTVTVLGAGPIVEAGGPYAGVEGQPLLLSALGTSPNGGIAKYEWDTELEVVEENPLSYSWPADGHYTATVTATDGVGLEVSDIAAVSIADTAPTASFDAKPLTGIAPLLVDFDDTSTAYDGIAQRDWDFGDGSLPVQGPSPTHTFETRGLFDVELVATDGDGSTAMTARSIAVSSGLNLLDDLDGDGMADVWEDLQGLDTSIDDSLLNPDLDILTNIDEHRLGKLPNDATSTGPGPDPSYLLFLDDFGDTMYDDRWSLGLESPLAENGAVEGASSITLDVLRPVSETCSTTSLVSFPTVTANDAVFEARVTMLGAGELCVGVIAGEDPENRIEMCSTALPDDTRDVRLRRTVDGVVMDLGEVLVPLDDAVFRLEKHADLWLGYHDGVFIASHDHPSVDAEALRPMLSARVCQGDADDLEARIDWVEMQRDSDGDGFGDLEEDPNGDGIVDPGETDPSQPDTDGDGLDDTEDNCPTVDNVDQLDIAGPTGVPNDVGDVCECGDVDGDDNVDAIDVAEIRDALIGVGPMPLPGRCNAIGPRDPGDLDLDGIPDDCRILDLVVIVRAIDDLEPGIEQQCIP